jgi:hypothetical protein
MALQACVPKLTMKIQYFHSQSFDIFENKNQNKNQHF